MAVTFGKDPLERTIRLATDAAEAAGLPPAPPETCEDIVRRLASRSVRKEQLTGLKLVRLFEQVNRTPSGDLGKFLTRIEVAAEQHRIPPSTQDDRREVYDSIRPFWPFTGLWAGSVLALMGYAGQNRLRSVVEYVTTEVNSERIPGRPRPVSEEQALTVLRAVAGPARLVEVNPAWLAYEGGIVKKLAEGIYKDRAYDRMPILGDGLEEAGCANEAILNHCRGSGPRCRGDWVLDLLLGKS